MFSYIPMTKEIYEKQWQKTIDTHPGDMRWVNWRDEYRRYYKLKMSAPFAVMCGDRPVGEVTLLFSPLCKALAGRCVLADGKTTANINALRIEKQYEGQGHISKLMKAAEEYAASLGYKYLTIGVTSTHTRTKAIYHHFGYTHLLFSELDEGEIVEYYRKEI